MAVLPWVVVSSSSLEDETSFDDELSSEEGSFEDEVDEVSVGDDAEESVTLAPASPSRFFHLGGGCAMSYCEEHSWGDTDYISTMLVYYL